MPCRRNFLLGGLSLSVAGIGNMDDAAMAQGERRAVTLQNPFVITNPVLGLLNLLGAAGDDLLKRDQADIGQLFSTVRVSVKDVPKCNVLFLYCQLDDTGRVAGTSSSLRDLIKAAQAHVMVVASPFDPKVVNSQLVAALGSGNDWPANVVITFDRRGSRFGRFFKQLFSRMLAGVTMPMAWVELAPQDPAGQDDNPGTMFIPEVGYIAFGPKR
jgi:hypothetical protein